MKKFKRLAPAVALLMAAGLLSACDNKEVVEKLTGQIEAAKGEIAAATKGLGDRLKQGMADLDAKIAAATGKADKAAAAAVANAGKAGALDNTTKALGAALDEVKAQVGASSKTLGASVDKVSVEVGALTAAVKSLSAAVEMNQAQVGAVDGAAKSLAAAVEKVQAQVGKVGSATTSLNAGLDKVQAQVDSIGESIKTAHGQVTAHVEAGQAALDDLFADLRNRVEAAEKNSADLKKQVGDLAERLAAAEAKLKAPAQN